MLNEHIINSYILELIRIELIRDNKLSIIPTPNEWQQIYIKAKQQTLLGILFSAIDKLPAEQRPPRPLLLQWFAATETIKEQNKKINEDAVKICQIVRKDGFRCIVLKGQGIATYYPDSLLRTPGDIDLWIEGGSKKVIKYLQSKGRIKSASYMHADCDVPVSTEVEIHYKPSYFLNPIYSIRLNRFLAKQNELFNNYIELPDETGKLYVPSVEFNRFYILQHIYRHYFGEGIGLRQLLDYYYVLLKGGTKESKQRTLEMFKRTGMMKFVGATMWVMKEVFSMDDKYLLCAPNEKAGKKLLDEIMLAGNFGKYDTRINRTNHHKLLPRFWSSIKRKVRFILDYPQEILFDVPMRTYMYIWKHFVSRS